MMLDQKAYIRIYPRDRTRRSLSKNMSLISSLSEKEKKGGGRGFNP